MRKVDLHIHTIFSDGTLVPEEVVKIAYKCGLKAIAIADHDEIGGVTQAYKTSKELGVEIIPTVELSAKKNNKSIHILGYFIDLSHPELLKFLSFVYKARLERAEKIVNKLNKIGIQISIEDVKRQSKVGVICRPHIADELVSKGIVKNTKEAFLKYLGINSPYYVPRWNASTEWVIKLIIKAGGIPVLAHPASSGIDEWIEELVKEGIRGIEVWYPTHSESDVDKYLRIANKYNLLPTGGSDSHGTRERYLGIGEFSIPYNVLAQLKKALPKT
jgi:hypothetical protein